MGNDRVDKGLGAGRMAKKCGRLGHTLSQKIMGFFSKFPCKSQFTPAPNFGNLERKFRKENFGKGKF
jgi:hypothetical protein